MLACLAHARAAAPSATSPALGDAIAALLAAKQAAGCRPAYVRSLRQYLAQFARGRADRPLGEITVEDLDAWFAARAEAPATRASNAGRLSALWAFAIRRGWVTDNPARRLERVRVAAPSPRVLTPEQAEIVLARTRAERPATLAVVALALLAGLRPAEARQMRWEGIRGDRVIVDAAESKVHQRRIVPLRPAARAWLEWPAWPQDVLRHTCASYWVAADGGELGRVAAALGHSPRILARHYRALVSEEAAGAFWAMRPIAS